VPLLLRQAPPVQRQRRASPQPRPKRWATAWVRHRLTGKAWKPAPYSPARPILRCFSFCGSDTTRSVKPIHEFQDAEYKCICHFCAQPAHKKTNLSY